MPALIQESPIEEVRLVARYRHAGLGFRFQSASLPGHLIHLMIAGRVRQTCDGRSYELSAGDAIWYHEDEAVSGEVIAAPWEFLSVNLIAPTLPPPGEDARQGGFSRTRAAPKDHRRKSASALDQSAQNMPFAHQMFLAGEFRQIAWSHPFGQRDATRARDDGQVRFHRCKQTSRVFIWHFFPNRPNNCVTILEIPKIRDYHKHRR